MAIRVLDERHKEAVVLELRGRPKAEIARKLGVSRSTVFAWFDDPLVIAYRSKLQAEVDAARKRLFRAPLIGMVELLRQAIANQLRDQVAAGGGDSTAMTRTIPLQQLVKIAHELAEIDSKLNPPELAGGSALPEPAVDADLAADVAKIVDQLDEWSRPPDESANTGARKEEKA